MTLHVDVPPNLLPSLLLVYVLYGAIIVVIQLLAIINNASLPLARTLFAPIQFFGLFMPVVSIYVLWVATEKILYLAGGRWFSSLYFGLVQFAEFKFRSVEELKSYAKVIDQRIRQRVKTTRNNNRSARPTARETVVTPHAGKRQLSPLGAKTAGIITSDSKSQKRHVDQAYRDLTQQLGRTVRLRDYHAEQAHHYDNVSAEMRDLFDNLENALHRSRQEQAFRQRGVPVSGSW